MALDPSIALGVKSFAPPPTSLMDYALNGQKIMSMQQQMLQSEQDIAQSKQQTANLAAATPGIAADAAGKVREQAYNTFLKDNADKFYDTDPVTKTKTFNQQKAADLIAQGGYLDKARAGLSADLINQSQDIQNDQGKIRTQSDQVALNEKISKAVDDATSHISLLGTALPADQVDAGTTEMIDQTDKLFPGMGVGDKIRARLMKQAPITDASGRQIPRTQYDPETKQQVPLLDAQGNPLPQTKTVANVDAMKSFKQAGIDAATQTNQEMARQQLKATLERYGQSPEAYQSGSSLSTMARDILTKQGIKVDPEASYRDLMQVYGDKLQDLATNGVMSKEMLMTVKEKLAAAQTDVYNINDAMKAASRYPQLMGTKLGKFLSAEYNKHIADSPGLSRLTSSIQLYNERFKNDPIDPANLTTAQIIEKLDAWKGMRLNDLRTNAGNFNPNLQTGGSAAATESGANAAEQPAPGGTPSQGAGVVSPQQKAPNTRSDGFIHMRSPDGKTERWVPPSSVKQAQENSWRIM